MSSLSFPISLKNIRRFLFVLTFLWGLRLLGQDNLEIHTDYRPIQDYAKILSEADNDIMTQLLLNYEKKSKNQIVFAIVNSIHGKNLEEYANDWANKLGIGQKDSNNGIFVLIVMDTRKIRIEIGYGLENKFPDIAASDIIENHISPYFKKNLFAEGIKNAINEFQKHLDGDYKEDSRFAEFYHKRNKKWYDLRSVEILIYSFSLAFIIFFGWFLYNSLFRKIVSVSEKEQKLEPDNSKLVLKIFSLLFFCLACIYFTIRLGIRFNPKIIDVLLYIGINFIFTLGLTVIIFMFSKHLNKLFIAVITPLSVVFILHLYLISLSHNEYLDFLRAINSIFKSNSGLHLYENLFIGFFVFFIFLFAMAVFVQMALGSEFSGTGTSKGKGHSYSSSSRNKRSSFKGSFRSSSRIGGGSSYGGGSFGGGGASGGW